MPVPKQRVGHSDQGHRRSCWKATTPTLSVCSNCGAFHRSHTICENCGWYKGRVVSQKFAAAAASSGGHEGHDHDHDHEHHDHDHDHEGA